MHFYIHGIKLFVFKNNSALFFKQDHALFGSFFLQNKIKLHLKMRSYTHGKARVRL
jgi:hypothetical protein